jgi:hypothetical protein
MVGLTRCDGARGISLEQWELLKGISVGAEGLNVEPHQPSDTTWVPSLERGLEQKRGVRLERLLEQTSVRGVERALMWEQGWSQREPSTLLVELDSVSQWST